METRNKTSLTVAAILVLALALAFGALGAALAAGKAVLWDELPYAEPSRLVEMSGTFEEKGEVQPWAIGHLDFLDWRRQNKAFESVSVFTVNGFIAFNLQTGKDLERLDGELVSHTYFDTLGVAPLHGRFFTAEEDGTPFVHPVVVLSHGLWQRRFGADPAIVGRNINLNGKDWQVVGVAPEGFRGVMDTAQFWIPSSMVPAAEYVEVRRMRWLNAVGRLKPGVTLEQAQADMDRVTAALAQQYPDQNRGIGVKLQPLRDFVYGAELKEGLRRVLQGAAVLLLLALVDAAGLLRLQPAAGSVRRGIVSSVVAAVLGLALAAWALQGLLPTSGLTFPSYARLSPGPAVAAGLLALAVLCGVLAGLLARWRPVRVLVGIAALIQVVLAVGLLMRAGTMSRDIREVVSRDLGIRTEGLLTMRLDLEKPEYAKDEDVARLAGEYLRRLETLPEVESAAITGPTMATDDWAAAFVTAEDHDNRESVDGTYKVLTHGVSPDYFKVMGVPVLQGRAFNFQDTQGYPVILSRGLAEAMWPKQNPLGKRLKFSARKVQPRPWLKVVGVVENARYQGFFKDERPAPDFYLSVLQQPVRLPMVLNVLARPKAGVSMASLESAVRRGILAVTPDTPPYDVATLEERLDKQTWKTRFESRIVGLFAALALALAAAGVYAGIAGRTGRQEAGEIREASPASRRRAAQ
ncbi:MAG TPA: ABC transporter permease [Thermoanaerobaculia bacterium]|nr:ABC transporter permease [Thermoanaerobaculia bacterium]